MYVGMEETAPGPRRARPGTLPRFPGSSQCGPYPGSRQPGSHQGSPACQDRPPDSAPPDPAWVPIRGNPMRALKPILLAVACAAPLAVLATDTPPADAGLHVDWM